MSKGVSHARRIQAWSIFDHTLVGIKYLEGATSFLSCAPRSLHLAFASLHVWYTVVSSDRSRPTGLAHSSLPHFSVLSGISTQSFGLLHWPASTSGDLQTFSLSWTQFNSLVCLPFRRLRVGFGTHTTFGHRLILCRHRNAIFPAIPGDQVVLKPHCHTYTYDAVLVSI